MFVPFYLTETMNHEEVDDKKEMIIARAHQILLGETRVLKCCFFRFGLNNSLPLPCGEPWL